MNKKRIVKTGVIVLVLLLVIAIDGFVQFTDGGNLTLTLKTTSDITADDEYQVYYLTDAQADPTAFSEQQTAKAAVSAKGENVLAFSIPVGTSSLRMDPGNYPGTITIEEVSLEYKGREIKLDDDKLNQIVSSQDAGTVHFTDGTTSIKSESDDPYFVWDVSSWEIAGAVSRSVFYENLIYKAAFSAAILLLLAIYLWKFEFFWEFPREIFQCKKLIFELSKNDFKTKYAGSYLGIIWAFVQPIITVLLYWFVFEKGLKSGSMMDVPFVLWLIAGLVPWFFFSDGLNGGTAALVEYQYLVKKVVFRIDILPLVKVASALFVHLFFAAFMLVLYICYGYYPNVYTLQIVYYSLCVLILALGLSYFTSAILCFFRDLTQIINILLQIGMWMTPIMWNFDLMDLPGWCKMILKLNPMFYIVQGYRDALINKAWFFQHPSSTLYFWIVTVAVMGIGMVTFKRLKVHFADVL